jgi:hypothetical protein
LHLLLLAEALADQDVDRGFDERGRDDLDIAPTLSVIWDRADIVPDLGGELGVGWASDWH